MGYFGQLGAVGGTGTWTSARYESTATAKAEATPGNFLIVTVGFDGSFVRAVAFPSAVAAAATTASSSPIAPIWYVGPP